MWSIALAQRSASTQDSVRALVRGGAPEGVGQRALVQSGGRGRHGRVWNSQAGDLTFSFLLRPARPLSEWGTLSLVVGLALAQAIDLPAVQLKWPNDLLLDGRKCAGILCEVEEDALIVGIGANCSALPQESPFATLLGQWEAGALMQAFCARFDSLYTSWQAQGFADLRALWLAYAHKLDAPISVKQGVDEICGFFAGIGDDGALLFKDEKGTIKHITAGELLFKG